MDLLRKAVVSMIIFAGQYQYLNTSPLHLFPATKSETGDRALGRGASHSRTKLIDSCNLLSGNFCHILTVKVFSTWYFLFSKLE